MSRKLLFLLLVFLAIGLSYIALGEDSCSLIYRDPVLREKQSQSMHSGSGGVSAAYRRILVYLHANDTMTIRVFTSNSSARKKLRLLVEDLSSGRSWNYSSPPSLNAYVPPFIAPNSSVYRVFIEVRLINTSVSQVRITVSVSAGSRKGFENYYMGIGVGFLAPVIVGGLYSLAREWGKQG